MNIKHILLFVSLVSIFFLRPEPVIAEEVKELYFYDNFSSVSGTWDSFSENSNISYSLNGLTLSSSNSRSFPFIFNVQNIFPDQGDYELNIKYSFPTTTNFGVGFGFGNYIPVYGLQNYNDPNIFRDWVYFYTWQGINDKHSIYASNCSSSNTCPTGLVNIYSSNPSNIDHDLTIKYINSNFFVKHNSENITNPVLLSSTRRPDKFWIGNPIKLLSNNNWTTINIKSITVFKLKEIENKKPVVILPGFGGSWDLPAIISGQPGTNWKIPSFVKEYDGIVNSLKNAGYVEGKDLFIFAYDWRKSLNDLSLDLKAFLINNNLTDKKINIVGHSMGGLVARTYLQLHDTGNVDKLVTVGTPHQGILDAYAMWEGGELWDGVWWQKVLLGLSTKINKQNGEMEIDAVRRTAPAIKDLLPSYDFLVNATGKKPWNTMVWKNDFQGNLNSQLNPFLARIVSGASTSYSNTKTELKVENRTQEDKILGLWDDGRPKTKDQFIFSGGDGYVNSKSALSLFDNKLSLTGGHGETISSKDNILKILTELGVATGSATYSDSDSRNSALVVKLNSPGTLEVCSNNVCDQNLGLVFSNEKLIIVPGFASSDYSIKVKSLGETGNYNLLVGEISSKALWSNIDGKLNSPSQIDSYVYRSKTDQILADSGTIETTMGLYWTKKIKLSQVNEERKKILADIDLSIKKNKLEEFDGLMKKWNVLDVYVASNYTKEPLFNHDGWDLGKKRIKESRYLVKSKNYYSSELYNLLKEKEEDYKLTPIKELKLKLDKLVQVLMLKSFID